MNYTDFLARKTRLVEERGVESDDEDIHAPLYPFQRAIVRWALRKGRAAIFADCGLGKTLMQLEWARHVLAVTGRPVLIIAPLAVGSQTVRESGKLDIGYAFQVRDQSEVKPLSISVTNYEMLEHFDPAAFGGVVLDESSILKSLDGKIRGKLISDWTCVPWRLCCTATPAPNDVTELANHAEFLGARRRVEMLAEFFVHDSDESAHGGYRLKRWGQEAFWRFVATWAVWTRRPSDLGFNDDGFLLPPLNIHDEIVAANLRPDGFLFHVGGLGGISERREARRATLETRVRKAADLIGRTPGQWLVWCGLNAEGDAIEAALGDECVQIAGKDDDEEKLAREWQWRSGHKRVLISKPAIFGWGMNWQHCSQILFLGIGDSYEEYYQAIRRCWRFGQTKPVEVTIVVSDAEHEVPENVRRKEREAQALTSGVIEASKEAMMDEVVGVRAKATEYATGSQGGEGWTLYLGDCVDRIADIPSEAIGFSVFSPPFASLYTYSPSDRDMGNSRDYDQFFEHFGFLVPELLRVTMPGRRCAVHCQQVTTTKATHGVIGWRDFRADIVKLYVSCGWVYDGEVVIDKDPQAQAIRTKSKALMFVQKNKDSSWCRPAMADYILLFRHPGENTVPVVPDVDNEEWIQWARPIWYGIRESDTLQAVEARDERDEKHICPLQLETIERCVRLWSNRGDLVLSPFAGIGSEGYMALKLGRKFVGIELKESYFQCAAKNLRVAERTRDEGTLFADEDGRVDGESP